MVVFVCLLEENHHQTDLSVVYIFQFLRAASKTGFAFGIWTWLCAFCGCRQVKETGIARHVFDDTEGGFDEPETAEAEGFIVVCVQNLNE